ncbi:hypothetical protein C8Q74DRAFT_333089 [Fomes fomentarius]|nr:hypothetical protein C8Q74DRAFT_333089 [Fomes fomentarius]
MLHNGCIYFVVLATLNILHMVLTALSIKIPSGSESFVINFIDPITSILVCHFLISLQEAKHTSQPDTVPSFVHPDLATGSGLDFAVPIPSLRMSMPSFVASLAGPLAVYSTANQSALVDVESHFDDDDIDGGRGSGLSTADSGDLEGASSRDTRTEVVSGCAGLTREKGNILNSAEGEASSSKTYGERSVSAI